VTATGDCISCAPYLAYHMLCRGFDHRGMELPFLVQRGRRDCDLDKRARRRTQSHNDTCFFTHVQAVLCETLCPATIRHPVDLDCYRFCSRGGAADSFPRKIFSPPAHLVLRRGPPFIMARGNRRCMLPCGEAPCAWIQRGSAKQQSRRAARTM
jgi:hypothetical protein